MAPNAHILGRLTQMVLDDVQSGRLFSEVLDHYDGAAANLARLALFIDLAQARPFTQLLVRVDANQRNLVLVAQRRDQLLVLRLIAALGQNGEHGLTFVECLAGLVDAVHETVGDQRLLEHLLQGGVDVHRSADDGRGDGHFTVGGKEHNRISVLLCFPKSMRSTYTSMSDMMLVGVVFG